MILDIVALRIGKLVIISLMIGLLGLIWYYLFNYLYKNLPAFRFAVWYWITSEAKEDMLKEINIKGEVWQVKKVEKNE